MLFWTRNGQSYVYHVSYFLGDFNWLWFPFSCFFPLCLTFMSFTRCLNNLLTPSCSSLKIISISQYKLGNTPLFQIHCPLQPQRNPECVGRKSFMRPLWKLSTILVVVKVSDPLCLYVLFGTQKVEVSFLHRLSHSINVQELLQKVS